MDAHLFGALDGLDARLNHLIASLTTSPTAAGAPAAAVALLEADDALSSALETLRKHQANHTKILSLRAAAESLEDRIKGIVRDIEAAEKEIVTACGNDNDDCSASDSNWDSEDDDNSEELDDDLRGKYDAGYKSAGHRRHKEVDYRLLLEFARRISKYNQQAAADAAVGARPIKKLDGDEEMASVNGSEEAPVTMGEGIEEGAEPVASITKDATQWLDDSANMARQAYMVPYPSEDRIRMGVMGQLQLAAAEGAVDPEKEAEKMVQDSEGWGTATTYLPPDLKANEHLVDEAANAAAHIGSAVVEGIPGRASSGAALAHKPKITIDLDLYDSDDDDI
jgi:Vitamin-D-receptor interacting Mediator subunit 4